MLTGSYKIEDSLDKLDKLTQEEARIASAELLKITHNVDHTMKGVDEKVEDVRDDVHDVGNKVQGVDNKFNHVNRSLTFHSLLTLPRLRQLRRESTQR